MILKKGRREVEDNGGEKGGGKIGEQIMWKILCRGASCGGIQWVKGRKRVSGGEGERREGEGGEGKEREEKMEDGGCREGGVDRMQTENLTV